MKTLLLGMAMMSPPMVPVDQAGGDAPAILPDTMIREWVASANESVVVGDLEAASNAYRELDERTGEGPMRAVVHYNRGVVLAGREAYAEAAEQFRLADLTAGDEAVRRDARFNLGRAIYDEVTAPLLSAASAQTAPTSEPSPEISADQIATRLLESASAFRSCLEIDAADLDAAKNVERIRLMVNAIREEQKRQEEMQQQAGEMANELEQLAEEQEQQSQSTANASPEDMQQQAEAQKDLSERTQDALERMQEMSEQMEGAAESAQEAREQQDAAEASLEEQAQQQGSEQQQSAADALREAAQQAREAAGEGEEGGEGEEEQQGEGDSEEQGESEQPGDQLAREILDKEEQEQRMRRARESRRGRPMPVERDW